MALRVMFPFWPTNTESPSTRTKIDRIEELTPAHLHAFARARARSECADASSEQLLMRTDPVNLADRSGAEDRDPVFHLERTLGAERAERRLNRAIDGVEQADGR